MFRLLQRRRRARDVLDTVLLEWTPSDPFTVRDLLNGGIATFGRSGSAKTSSSGKAIGRAVIGYRNSGGLILAAKPEDVAMWQALFADCGRQRDLIVFGSLEDKWRFNFLDFVSRNGGHTREITSCIRTIGETLRSGDGKGQGEDGDFWEQQQDRLIYNAVEVVKLATGNIAAPDLQRFISSAAHGPQQISSDEWQAGFHNQCLKKAFARRKSAIEEHDYQLAVDYWLAEFPQMADKTRSSILAGVMGVLHVFNTGIVRELVSTATNVTPNDMFEGKWILVNMAPAAWGDIGKFINAGWKYLTQRANLRRHVDAGSRINVIWCDEAQQFVSSFDAHYLAQCRSHLGCMVYLTQSLHSYYSALKGEAGRHQADALLSNFHHKLFHALGDAQTAEWAATLVGRSLQTFVGGSSQDDGDLFASMSGQNSYTGSFSEHYEQILQNNSFLTGLRTGGPDCGFLADAILIRSGMPFSSGDSFLHCTFSQRA
jgi:type IV secretory pathway TraG/TraD family ATPase VirD4